MEIKRTISRIAWNIEPKSEGGFIARCSDPAVPPIEGTTQQELQQKIQDKMSEEITAQLPGLKLDFNKPGANFISIQANAGGSAVTKTGDLTLQPIEGSTRKAVENWLAQNAGSLLEKQVPPELLEQLKAKGIQGNVKLVVTKGGGETQVRSQTFTVTSGIFSSLFKPKAENPGASQATPPVSASFSGTQLDTASPITPVSGGGSFMRFVIAALIVLGLIFLFTHVKR